MSYVKLTNKMENKIRILIRTWEGKFGWKEIIAAIKNDFDLTITKPSLTNNPVIYPEYLARKQGKSGVTDDPVLVGASEAKLIKTIKKLEKDKEKLKAEIEMSKETNSTQLAFIENMIENARAMGIELQKLVEPRG